MPQGTDLGGLREQVLRSKGIRAGQEGKQAKLTPFVWLSAFLCLCLLPSVLGTPQRQAQWFTERLHTGPVYKSPCRHLWSI